MDFSKGAHLFGPAGPPVYRIPDDVLREIFLHSMLSSNTPVHPSAMEGPLQASQVCSNWRAVAHDCARLWGSLTIERPHFEPNLIDETQRWLHRANNTPIHFQLVLTSDRPNRVQYLRTCLGQDSGPSRNLLPTIRDSVRKDPIKRRAYLDELEQTLAHTPLPSPSNTLSKMLKSVGSSITRLVLRNVPVPQLVRLPRQSFPILERLVLVLSDRLNYWEFDWITNGPIKAFMDCPSLHYVALGRYFREESGDFIRLPLRQLTHLIDCGPFYDTQSHPCLAIERFLAAGTNLHLLHVSLDNHRSGWPIPSGSVDFISSSVISLSIESVYETGISEDFLSTFSFPNLQSLRWYGPIIELDGFLQSGKGGNLEHLSVLYEDEIPLEFLQILSDHTPRLWWLEVAYTALGDVLEILSEFPSALTNLRTIAIFCQDTLKKPAVPGEFSLEEGIRGFINARCKGRSRHQEHAQCLQTFKIFDGVPNMASADQLHDVLCRLRDEEELELEVIWDSVGDPNGILDPLFTDPELANWDGLHQLRLHPFQFKLPNSGTGTSTVVV